MCSQVIKPRARTNRLPSPPLAVPGRNERLVGRREQAWKPQRASAANGDSLKISCGPVPATHGPSRNATENAQPGSEDPCGCGWCIRMRRYNQFNPIQLQLPSLDQHLVLEQDHRRQRAACQSVQTCSYPLLKRPRTAAALALTGASSSPSKSSSLWPSTAPSATRLRTAAGRRSGAHRGRTVKPRLSLASRGPAPFQKQ